MRKGDADEEEQRCLFTHLLDTNDKSINLYCCQLKERVIMFCCQYIYEEYIVVL